MPNETLLKFQYPESLLREYDCWAVLLRPAQVTVGSLVLASREEAQRFPDLTAAAFAELKQVSGDLESALSGAFGYEKINYLMLMMMDRHVHYHVIPRYPEPVLVDDTAYADGAWPGPPDLTRALELPAPARAAIKARIEAAWPD